MEATLTAKLFKMKNIFTLSLLTTVLWSCNTIPWDRSEPEILRVRLISDKSDSDFELIKILSNPESLGIYNWHWQFGFRSAPRNGEFSISGEIPLHSVFTVKLPDELPRVLIFQAKLSDFGGKRWRDVRWTGFTDTLEYPGNGVYGNSGVPALLLTSGSGNDSIRVQMTYTFAPHFIIAWEAMKASLLAYQKQVFQFLDNDNRILAELSGARVKIADFLSPDRRNKVLLLVAMTRIQQLLAQKTLQ